MPRGTQRAICGANYFVQCNGVCVYVRVGGAGGGWEWVGVGCQGGGGGRKRVIFHFEDN